MYTIWQGLTNVLTLNDTVVQNLLSVFTLSYPLLVNPPSEVKDISWYLGSQFRQHICSSCYQCPMLTSCRDAFYKQASRSVKHLLNCPSKDTGDILCSLPKRNLF